MIDTQDIIPYMYACLHYRYAGHHGSKFQILVCKNTEGLSWLVEQTCKETLQNYFSKFYPQFHSQFYKCLDFRRKININEYLNKGAILHPFLVKGDRKVRPKLFLHFYCDHDLNQHNYFRIISIWTHILKVYLYYLFPHKHAKNELNRGSCCIILYNNCIFLCIGETFHNRGRTPHGL